MTQHIVDLDKRTFTRKKETAAIVVSVEWQACNRIEDYLMLREVSRLRDGTRNV